MVYFILIGLSLFYLRNIMSNNNKRKAPKIVEEDEFSESSDDLEIDERSNELVETESDENVEEEESLTPIKKKKKKPSILKRVVQSPALDIISVCVAMVTFAIKEINAFTLKTLF